MNPRLSSFQREILRGFSHRAKAFYLTGGAALAEYHLGHRTTEDLVVVDLVLERVPHGEKEPLLQNGVAVDPPEEILANKLCTLLSRAELRDLIDVMALERAGYDLRGALSLAARKDAGMTPAQLAWVLSQIRIGDDAQIPGEVSVAELRSFLESLQQRLTRMAYPQQE